MKGGRNPRSRLALLDHGEGTTSAMAAPASIGFSNNPVTGKVCLPPVECLTYCK